MGTGALSLPLSARSGATAPIPVSQQIAVGVGAADGGSFEIRLDPEELGSLRIALQPEGETIRVTIIAERPETLDLIRRNLSELAAELRELGYGNASFGFGDRPAREGSARVASEGAGQTAEDDALPAAGRGALPADGLDIRL